MGPDVCPVGYRGGWGPGGDAELVGLGYSNGVWLRSTTTASVVGAATVMVWHCYPNMNSIKYSTPSMHRREPLCLVRNVSINLHPWTW